MSEIEFRSDMRVIYIDSMGDDKRIAQAARVSTGTDDSDRPHKELVERLWRDRHMSPFEHNVLTVKVEVPLFVAREWMTHRTQAFNEISGRYTEMKPVFYEPGESRPLMQVGKAMDYRREAGTALQAKNCREVHQSMAERAWFYYQHMLNMGVAREVARNVLPLSLFTQFYATANLRNWLHFVELRTDEAALWEIRQAALMVEGVIAELWPITHAAYRKGLAS